MRLWKWLFAPVVALAAVTLPVRADDAAPTAPTLLVRLASIDTMLADAKYIAALAGQEEQATQFEKMLPNLIPGGLAGTGLDTKKPIGMYGILTPGVQDSVVVVMVPVANEKAFVDTLNKMLGNFNVTAAKGADGIYTVAVPGLPFEAYFTFAENYVYVTARDKDPIAAGKRFSAAKLLKGDDTTVLSASLRLDLIDKNLKQLALGQLENQMAAAKERKGANETEAQTKLKVAVVDYVAQQIRSLMTDGKAIEFQATIDRKTDDMATQFTVSAVDGSPLAQQLKSLDNLKGRFGGVSGAAAKMGVNFSVPAELRELLAGVVDEAFKRDMEKQQDPKAKAAAQKMYDAMKPSLKAGILDLHVAMVGPDSAMHYTIAGGLRVKDAPGLEKAVKEVVPLMPDDKPKAEVKFDAETINGVKVHKIVPPTPPEGNAKNILGEKAFIMLAFPPDGVAFAVGADPSDGIKKVLGSTGQPGGPLAMEGSITQLAGLDEQNGAAAQKVAKEVFGANPQSDVIRLSVDGGSTLKIRASMKGQVIKFGTKMDAQKKGGNP